MGAQPKGAPGCPEFAASTMSADRHRTVLIHCIWRSLSVEHTDDRLSMVSVLEHFGRLSMVVLCDTLGRSNFMSPTIRHSAIISSGCIFVSIATRHLGRPLTQRVPTKLE